MRSTQTHPKREINTKTGGSVMWHQLTSHHSWREFTHFTSHSWSCVKNNFFSCNVLEDVPHDQSWSQVWLDPVITHIDTQTPKPIQGGSSWPSYTEYSLRTHRLSVWQRISFVGCLLFTILSSNLRYKTSFSAGCLMTTCTTGLFH